MVLKEGHIVSRSLIAAISILTVRYRPNLIVQNLFSKKMEACSRLWLTKVETGRHYMR